jgi:hypothetical protein
VEIQPPLGGNQAALAIGLLDAQPAGTPANLQTSQQSVRLLNCTRLFASRSTRQDQSAEIEGRKQATNSELIALFGTRVLAGDEGQLDFMYAE